MPRSATGQSVERQGKDGRTYRGLRFTAKGNMTVILLGAILEGAVERELIARNPARGRGRRVRERTPRRSYLDTAAQIGALLDAAADLDRGVRTATDDTSSGGR